MRGERRGVERVQGDVPLPGGGQELGGARAHGIHGEDPRHDVARRGGVLREAAGDEVGVRQDIGGGDAGGTRVDHQHRPVKIAKRAQRTQVGGLELRIVRRLREDARDVSPREEAPDLSEVGDVMDEPALDAGILLQQADRIDVQPAQLDPDAAAGGGLHDVDGMQGGVDGVHARGAEEQVRGRDAFEEGHERGAHFGRARVGRVRLIGEPSLGLTGRNERARVLHELGQPVCGVA